MSKLGAFVMAGTPGAHAIAQAGPPVLVAFDPHRIPGVLDVIRTYKRLHPAGKVVLRQYHDTHALSYTRADDPVASATDYFKRGVVPATEALWGEPIDFVSGPNEFGGLPSVYLETAWHGRFWAQFALIARSAGYRPNILDIPVGNVGPEHVAALLPAFRETARAGGVWSYHGYTLDYRNDVGHENWYSLRYRMIQTELARHGLSVPVILTEAGVDRAGNPALDGWLARGTVGQYQDWLRWFDAEITHDASVLGACLFQIGDSLWSSFDIEPIAPWLAAQLQPPAPPSRAVIAPGAVAPPPPAAPPAVIAPEAWAQIEMVARRIAEEVIAERLGNVGPT